MSQWRAPWLQLTFDSWVCYTDDMRHVHRQVSHLSPSPPPFHPALHPSSLPSTLPPFSPPPPFLPPLHPSSSTLHPSASSASSTLFPHVPSSSLTLHPSPSSLTLHPSPSSLTLDPSPHLLPSHSSPLPPFPFLPPHSADSDQHSAPSLLSCITPSPIHVIHPYTRAPKCVHGVYRMPQLTPQVALTLNPKPEALNPDTKCVHAHTRSLTHTRDTPIHTRAQMRARAHALAHS